MNSIFSDKPEWGILEIKFSHEKEDEEENFTTHSLSFTFNKFQNMVELFNYLTQYSIKSNKSEFCSHMLEELISKMDFKEI